MELITRPTRCSSICLWYIAALNLKKCVIFPYAQLCQLIKLEIKNWVLNINYRTTITKRCVLMWRHLSHSYVTELPGWSRSTSASTMAPWRSCAFHQFWLGVFSWPTAAMWSAILQKTLDTAQWPSRLLGWKLAAPRLGWGRAGVGLIIWLLSHSMWREGQYGRCLQIWEKHTTEPCLQVPVTLHHLQYLPKKCTAIIFSNLLVWFSIWWLEMWWFQQRSTLNNMTFV